MDKERPRFLILETSARRGQVALATEGSLLDVRRLDEGRGHARDLAPAIREMLTAANWRPSDIAAVFVSHGPGSYTGLRVGIMSAKTFAYATGCALLTVETFAAIAVQAPPEVEEVEIIADAQQKKIYAQRFRRKTAKEWQPLDSLRIISLAEWLHQGHANRWITGPGLHVHARLISESIPILEQAVWDPQPESFMFLGLARFRAGERDELHSVEPLYLRPSSAEEKMAARSLS
jgi:tRNA threonylcarbamoyladenosine biosynthesis protein TsaB